MSHEVYANGREVAGKSGQNKSIARFPDVCMSPPGPPAGPVPVPYSDTSFSTDLKEGSSTVKLGGQPAALAQQSYYQPAALGNEAATRAWGMNVVTHQITGKTYFQAWSMDTRIEGKNVCRHLDITTSNHASSGTTTSPNASNEKGATGDGAPEEKKCPCCGGAPHSDQQKDGSTKMTAKEWYTPNYPDNKPKPNKQEQAAIEHAAFLFEYAQVSGCEGSLPSDDPTDPCSAHYAVGPESVKQARKDFDAQCSPNSDLEGLSLVYGEPQAQSMLAQGARIQQWRKDGAISVAHKTALAAGGCPVGAGNHHPVKPECKEVEGELGTVQGKIGEYHRRVHNLNPKKK